VTLSQKLTALFDSRIRARGEVYFWRGRVRVRLGSEREVEARVQGSRTYEVSLVWKEKGVLSVDCECEYFQSAGEQLRLVLDEGHKALVFSQFTSLLRIVRDRLDAEGCAYEYLDGATRDRRKPVERFQNDPDCRLFLISLKAGGLGLNLTAAEYVFLLDPWWNPAVEAQAVDRAHRIGQSRPVFAYRLLARDTVEEKVLELQKTKRDLAAILSADNSLIRNLRREDIELLLS
jgi:SNF2 family DNA or RNA helicase